MNFKPTVSKNTEMKRVREHIINILIDKKNKQIKIFRQGEK